MKVSSSVAATAAVHAHAHAHGGRDRRRDLPRTRTHGVGVVLLVTVLLALYPSSPGGLVAAAGELVDTTSTSTSTSGEAGAAAAATDQADLGGIANLSSESDDSSGEQGDDDAILDGLVDDAGVVVDASQPGGGKVELEATAISVVDAAVSYVRNLFASSASSSSSPPVVAVAVDSEPSSTRGTSAADDDASTPDADAGGTDADANADVKAGATAEPDAGVEKGRSLAQRKYVETKERARKGANKKGSALTKKELRFRMRRHRRRRRRKRGQSLADREEQIREKKTKAKKEAARGGNKAPSKVTSAYRIQDRCLSTYVFPMFLFSSYTHLFGRSRSTTSEQPSGCRR